MRINLPVLVLATLLTQVGADPARPDIIVTHLSRTPAVVTVHLQNLGPALARGSVHLLLSRVGNPSRPVEVDVPAPRGVFAVSQSAPVPLKNLGVEPDWNSAIIRVEIQSEQLQARQSNKVFYEQIERSEGVTREDCPPYVESKPALPDLVIEGVEYERPDYLKVVFANRGRGRTGADYIFSIRCGEKKFDGNYYYRYRVPAVGQVRKTGGFTMGNLGLKPGMKVQVTATVDPEGRVREINPNNNSWTGIVDLR